MNDRERRVIALPVELRRTADAPSQLSGYAAVFNRETTIAGLFREQIAPGAFADAIGRDDVRALFNHDSNIVLGRTPKTLTLREDQTGLRYDVDLPDTTAARDLAVSVERGDVNQSSFGFLVEEDAWEHPKTRTELPLRTIKRVRLFDVSPVTFPAYDETTATARSAAEQLRAADDAAADHARAVARARFDLMALEASA